MTVPKDHSFGGTRGNASLLPCLGRRGNEKALQITDYRIKSMWLKDYRVKYSKAIKVHFAEYSI